MVWTNAILLLLVVLLGCRASARYDHDIFQAATGFHNGWRFSDESSSMVNVSEYSMTVHVDGRHGVRFSLVTDQYSGLLGYLSIDSFDCALKRSKVYLKNSKTNESSREVYVEDESISHGGGDAAVSLDTRGGYCSTTVSLENILDLSLLEWDTIVFEDISGMGFTTHILGVGISFKTLKESGPRAVPLYIPSSAPSSFTPFGTLKGPNAVNIAKFFENKTLIAELNPSVQGHRAVYELCGLIQQEHNSSCKLGVESQFSDWPYLIIQVPSLNALQGIRRSFVDTIRLLEVDTEVKIQRKLMQALSLPTECDFVPWHLDRIDQPDLPLNGDFQSSYGGSGVLIYVVDSGIRKTHQEFRTANKTRVGLGADCITPTLESLVDQQGAFKVLCKDSEDPFDDNSHGTHVAAIAAGSCIGIAKYSTIIPVKVIGKDGTGSHSILIAGLDWIRQDLHRRMQRSYGVPVRAVVSLSIGGGDSIALNHAVSKLDRDFNVPIIVAAGNNYGANACFSSPASAPETIVVTATDPNDELADYSNIGPCVSLLAPGTDVYSASFTGDNQYDIMSGTSQACPIVSGIVAVHLEHAERQGENISHTTDIKDLLRETSVKLASVHVNSTTSNFVQMIE